MLFFCWFLGRPKAAPKHFHHKNCYIYMLLLFHNFFTVMSVIQCNIYKIHSFH